MLVREVFLEEVASGLGLEDRVRALRLSKTGVPYGRSEAGQLPQPVAQVENCTRSPQPC